MIRNLTTHFVLVSLKFYKNSISAILPPSCRFYPSCSEYAVDSVKKHGVLKGLWYAIKRIAKCHPLGNGGYDPI